MLILPIDMNGRQVDVGPQHGPLFGDDDYHGLALVIEIRDDAEARQICEAVYEPDDLKATAPAIELGRRYPEDVIEPGDFLPLEESLIDYEDD